MLKKLIIFVMTMHIFSAAAMEVTSENVIKLGNPWAQLPEQGVLDVQAQALFEAIATQDSSCIGNLVAGYPYLLEARNKHGLTPLHYASNFKNVDVARVLIENGASVHADSPLGTPLHLAASEGVVSMIALLLAHGAHMHARDQWGRTPLYDAIYDLNYDAAEYLLKQGAGQSVVEEGASSVLQDNMGRTPLHTAVIRLNEVEDYKNKCKENPLAAIMDPDKYLIRYLVLAKERKCLARLVHKYCASMEDIQDRAEKTAHEYQLLINVLSPSKRQHEENRKSFLPPEITLRKSPIKSPTKKSPKNAKKGQGVVQPKMKSHGKDATQMQAVTATSCKELAPLDSIEEVTTQEKMQTVVQENVKEEKATSLYAGYTLDRFAKRVIDWFENTALTALLSVGSGWWHTCKVRRELHYHQIPFEIINDVIRFGKQELRIRANVEQGHDVAWRMHGCMYFDDGMHNPWCPGRSKQEGFFHCTQGRDGKIYHIGFDPIQEGSFLASYLPKEVMQEIIKTKLYDQEKKVTYMLYA